jgi:NAD(P)-dependent dehydrogenase (short-subunit alcohol dehydrogenase family)
VTGATDGIGLATAAELVRRGATVVVHGRKDDRIARAVATLRGLRDAAGSVAEPVRADFASLAEVRAMGEALAARPPGLDVVVHNAGVYMNERVLSQDGFEMTFAVNHLAPFVLTHALLAGITEDPASPTAARLARVVVVSSVAHTRGRLALDSVARAPSDFEPYAAYAASKLANVAFTVELARLLAPRGITVNALHPGVVSTKLLTEGFKMDGPDSVEQGAATSVMLALDPDVAATTGAYFVQSRRTAPSVTATDGAFARRFFEWTTELVRGFLPAEIA